MTWNAESRRASAEARRQRQAERDREAGPRIQTLRDEGLGWRKVADKLNAEGFRAPRGGTWQAHQVLRVAQRVEKMRQVPTTPRRFSRMMRLLSGLLPSRIPAFNNIMVFVIIAAVMVMFKTTWSHNATREVIIESNVSEIKDSDVRTQFILDILLRRLIMIDDDIMVAKVDVSDDTTIRLCGPNITWREDNTKLTVINKNGNMDTFFAAVVFPHYERCDGEGNVIHINKQALNFLGIGIDDEVIIIKEPTQHVT